MRPTPFTRIMLGVLCCCLALGSGFITASDTPVFAPRVETLPSRTQTSAEKALAEAIRTNNPGAFDQFRQSLRSTPHPYTTYWLGYTSLYESIYYLQKGDKPQAEKVVLGGIRLLEEQPTRSSEYYALLAYLQSYAIQFRFGLGASLAASRVKRNANEALKLDPRNPRAYYVLGSTDFYTPTRYGGGTTAEGYLLKVLSLPEQAVKNALAPSWGKENAYELLVRFYLRQKQPARARAYYQKARQLYPNSYALKTLAKNFV
jgi:tetratricopeptide (TPR) repeat protein